jgi:diguanylate cyclase (GGDEF)-like protein
MHLKIISDLIRQQMPPGKKPGLFFWKGVTLLLCITISTLAVANKPLHDQTANQTLSENSLLSTSENSEKSILEQAQRSGNSHQALKSLLQLSTIYAHQGNAQAIIDQSKQAIALAKQLKDKKSEADLLIDSGSAYGELGDIKEDIRHQFAAKALYENINDQEGIAATLNNIAGGYAGMGNHEKFLEYQNKSLAIGRQQNLYEIIALSLLNLGQHYAEIENNNIIALDYFMQALDILEDHSRKPAIYYAFSLSAIASSHFHIDDFEMAEYYNEQLKQMAKINGFEKSQVEAMLMDANLYLEKQQLQLAHQSLDKAEQLADKLQMEAEKTEIYQIRTDIHVQQEHFQEALHYHKMYTERRMDELEDENRRQILVSQAWFDSQEKQKTLDQLQRQKAEQNLKLKEQLYTERTLSAGILAATFIVLILLILIYQAKKSRLSAVEKSRFLSKAVAKAEKDARQDALTGLLNRRGFMELLEHEHLQMKYQHNQLTLILADIDHFKIINDKYGHECGDKALKKVADFLKHNIRDGDHISRWGGEEFLIMMPNTDSEAATHLTERIRKRLSETIFGCTPHQITLTMTFGVSQCTTYETVKHCISRADNALYRGKASGRNTVTVIQPQ